MFWWKCSECGGEYEAWIQSRIDGSKCPYCSGRIVKVGLNDLATTDPQIAHEWCYEGNKGVLPSDVNRNSKRIYWWSCPHGHQWQASVSARTIDKVTCSKCEEDFLQFLPKLLFMFYLHHKGIKVVRNTDQALGLPVDILVPQLRFGCDEKRRRYTSDQKVKRYMLEEAGYDYFLLPRCNSANEAINVVRGVLLRKHIHVDTNPEDDIRICRERFEIYRQNLENN